MFAKRADSAPVLIVEKIFDDIVVPLFSREILAVGEIRPPFAFQGGVAKARLVSGTDPNLDLSREFAPFPGKSGASQIFLQGLVAEILYFLSPARKVAEIERKSDLLF